MSLAVVRCPACRGDSRVAPDVLGQMVGCPRCQMPFVAEEDIPIIQPVWRGPTARRAPPAAPAARPRRRRPLPFEDEPGPVPAPEIHDPEHDPHARPVAGLPVSVLVGLALVPFGIPLLWRVAPLLTGHEAALSMAVPAALAVAASALCLGVVYTIDWTAATRVKGVLMLVALAYLSAAGLFFLKKDMMDRVRALGGDPNRWTPVAVNEGNCQTRMPGQTWREDLQPFPELVKMAPGRRARFVADAQEEPRCDYRFAASAGGAVVRTPDDAWFDRVGERLKGAGAKLVRQPDRLALQERPDAPGRQWMFQQDDGATVRIVRVYVVRGRVYYLSAEGPQLTPGDDYTKPFFDHFFVNLK